MKSLLRLLAAAALLPACVSAQTLVSDSFADAERSTQNLPSSLQWFASFSSSMSVSSGALRLSPTNNTVRAATAYFTPVALELGQAITLSLTFTPTVTAETNSPNGLRLGLFDSDGARLTGDGNPTDNTYRGYAVFLNPLTNSARIFERVGTGALLTSLGNDIYDTANPLASGSAVGETLRFEAGESYTASLTVARTTDNRWLIGFALSGGNIGSYSFWGEDTANVVTRFDTISFGLNSDMGATDFTNVSVTLTAIPEPGTYAALVGVAALVGAACQRRFRRKA